MENISSHIANLLYHHDCVIVPGLGGFVANPVPAMLDEEKNMFFPPSKEIVFNADLKHNDGLLISHIATQKNISYETAGEAVAEFVSYVTGKINKGEKISLGKIGELSSGDNGAFVFTPNATENFNTDSFGLSSFHFTPVVKYQHRNYRIHPAVKRTLPVRTRHLAAGIAVLAGLFLFSPEVKNPEVNRAGGVEFMTTGNSPTQAKTTERPDSKKETTTNNTAVTPPEQKEEKTTFNYFVIAGSFKRQAQAERYCKQLKSKTEINPLIIKAKNGRFRVAVDGYSTKKAALTALKSIRAQKGFKSAWILFHK